jgi:thiamine transport system ATP-binding protein
VLAAGGEPGGEQGRETLALRRSALRVASTGQLTGRVRSARLTPQAVRLTVEVPGVGEVHAVGDVDAAVPGPGREVRLLLDLTRTARLGTAGPRPRTP